MLQDPQRLGEIDRAIDLDGAGDGSGAQLAGLKTFIIAGRDGCVRFSLHPAQAGALKELVERVCSRGINYGKPRHP